MIRRLLVPFFLVLVTAAPVHAQWKWLYPRPQGHNLSDVVFLDNQTAVAVGEAGTILVTGDTGDTWTVSPMTLGVTVSLLRCDRVDAATVVAVGEAGVILRSADRGATWTLVPSGVTANITDVSFGDAQHGVAITATTALRTSDGGMTWLPASFNTPPVTSVDMVTPSFAVAIAEGRLLLRSPDGGATWHTQPVPEMWSAGEIEFRDATHGVIGGWIALVTDDAGVTWNPSYVWPELQWEGHWSPTPREFAFGDAGCIYAAVSATYAGPEASPFETPIGGLTRTLDDGGNWTHSGWTKRSMSGLARNDDGVILTVGDEGQIYRCTGGGMLTQIGGSGEDYQWGDSGLSFTDALHGLVMSSDDYYWRSGSSSVARTVNGGKTWSVSHVTGTQLSGLVHASESDVYGAGRYLDGVQGSIVHSPDGGDSWTSVWRAADIPGLTGIAFGTPDHGIATGSNGKVVVLDNDIATVVATGATTTLLDVAFASSTTAVAVGAIGTVLRTINGGSTWEQVPAGTTQHLHAIDFVDENTGFIAGENIVLYTLNGGLNWAPTFLPSAVLLDVDFIDRMHGIVVGRQGYASNVFFITDDGGFTWSNLAAPTRRPFTDVVMFSANHAYVGGLEQLLFQYGEPLPTPVRDGAPLARVQLLPNRPNPFNPVTTIPFVLDEKQHATLTVHDVTGRLVATLVDGVRGAGAQSIDWHADGVASGVYFARLRAGKTEVSQKMVLLK